MAVISKEDDSLTFDVTQDESYEFPSAQTSPPVVATPVSSLKTEDHSFQQASSDTGTTDLPKDNNRQIGAGIVVALVTLPLFGPFIAAVAGVAAAHGTTQDGAAGDICRAASDVAMTAKDKAIEMDKKHNIVNRSKENTQDFVNNVRKGDTHNLLEKIGEKLQEVFKVVGQFCDKNRRGRGEE